jgi:hypothetical protein
VDCKSLLRTAASCCICRGLSTTSNDASEGFLARIPRRPMLSEKGGNRRLNFRRAAGLFPAHRRARPAVQIAAVVFNVVVWPSGGADYPGSSRRRLRASTHHDSKSLSPLSRIRLSARPIQFRSQKHRKRRASAPRSAGRLLAALSAGARIRSTGRTSFRVHPPATGAASLRSCRRRRGSVG